MGMYKMAEMSLNDVREYLKSKQTIVFPYGVVEQHGHHLPSQEKRHLGYYGYKRQYTGMSGIQ